MNVHDIQYVQGEFYKGTLILCELRWHWVLHRGEIPEERLIYGSVEMALASRCLNFISDSAINFLHGIEQAYFRFMFFAVFFFVFICKLKQLDQIISKFHDYSVYDSGKGLWYFWKNKLLVKQVKTGLGIGGGRSVSYWEICLFSPG